MQQLHVVGFTTDHDALIFSARKGAKSGGFLVALDAKFLDTVDEATRARDGEGGKKAKRPSLPRPESALSPRDIQMRLRAGRSVSSVAAEAGVDEEWVLRFAAPILAEQALVVGKALMMTFAKARLGSSGRPLGESVWWNIADKGALMAQDTYDQLWTAQHLRDSSWIVRFDFVNRKKRQRAEWEVDTRENTLSARNRLASELGYIEPGRRGKPPAPLPPPAKPVAKRTAPVNTVAVSVAPVEKRRAAAKAPAAKKKRAAAKKRPVAKKRPAPRKAVKRAAANKRAVAKKRPAPRKAVKRAAAKKRPAARKATARPAARRAPARKRPPVKRLAAKRAAPKKVAAKRAAPKRAAAKKPAARKRPAAKRPPTKRRPAPAIPFETPAFDADATRPVTIRAARAGEPSADDATEPAALPPPPVLTSTPQAGAPRPAPAPRRFGRLRRRRPPGG